MHNDFQDSSRSNYRAKRKKTNFILNGLIVLVLVLIVFVAYSIFLSGDNNTAPKKEAQTTAEKTSAAKQSAHSINKDKASAKESSTSKQSNENTQGDQESTSATSGDNASSTSTDQTQTVDSPNANTAAPATTGQQHTTSYDTNSSDWQEMLQAISSATGIDQSTMTVWFLGSDKSTPNGSVGTVSAKGNKQQKYRVYLQWVDGQGWKTTKVEQVAQ